MAYVYSGVYTNIIMLNPWHLKVQI